VSIVFTIVGVAILFTYFLRDSQALSLYGDGFRFHGSLYFGANLLAVVGITAVAQPGNFESVFDLARRPAVWIAGVALHIGYWQLSQYFRRSGEASPAWLLSVLPSPVLILFLAAFAYLLGSGLPRWVSATFISLFWSACVVGTADWIAKDKTRSVGWEFVLTLLQGSNFFALLLVPFENLGELVRLLTVD
jgi:hypothetical protein